MSPSGRHKAPIWRVALVGDLALLSLAVSAFAYYPLFPAEPGEIFNPLSTQEALITVGGILVAAGLVSNLLPVRLPGSHWAYLGSSVLALVTGAIFFLDPPFHMGPGVATIIALILASNVVGGAAAHLVDGGGDEPRKGPANGRPQPR